MMVQVYTIDIAGKVTSVDVRKVISDFSGVAEAIEIIPEMCNVEPLRHILQKIKDKSGLVLLDCRSKQAPQEPRIFVSRHP